ncbi:MAG: outer membrane lipoprotein carrier protein LolA [Verrucomicrobiales bacterium]|nr:outer membrane lipoprotein carrier protein LolA [Verrucomicrobiales bacterium]
MNFELGALTKVFLLLVLFPTPPSPAAEASSPSAMLRSWLGAQTNIQSWSADFVQTRTLKALTQPLIATGHVWFAAPKRFRWELGQPPQTIAVRQTDEMVVIYPKLKRAERYPLTGHATGQWRDALALLETGFPRSQAEMDAQFKVLSLSQTNGIVELALQPKSLQARRMMPRIMIGFATNDFALRSTELQFADGSTMRNEFHSAQLNSPVEELTFRPKLDADYKIVEPLRK